MCLDKHNQELMVVPLGLAEKIVQIRKNGKIYTLIDDEGWDLSVINFCPVCGEKL